MSPVEAAQMLGCSRDFFEKHILGELRIVRRGRMIFIAVAELQRWLAENASLTLGLPRFR